MPYASEKQRRFFNANRKKLKSQGVDVDEWNASSKGEDLPEKASMKKAAAVLYHVLALNNLKHAQMQSPIPPPPAAPTPAPAVDQVTPQTRPPATMTPGTLTPSASKPTPSPKIAPTK